MESPRYTVSLLSGDLLGSLYPAAAKPLVLDGHKDGWGHESDVPLSPASDYQGASPLGADWLDTRVDLLDYLAGPELEGLHQDQPVSFVIGDDVIMHESSPVAADDYEVITTSHSADILVSDPSACAVQVLRDLAEEQTALLAEQATLSTSNPQRSPQVPMSPPASLVPASPPASLVPTSPPATLEEAQAELMDIFRTSLDQSEVEEIALDSSSVLADLTSADIDDILSSGPCTPESHTGSSGFDFSSAEQTGNSGFDFSSVELVEPENLDGSTEVITLSADVSQELLSLLAPAQRHPQVQQSDMIVELDPAYSSLHPAYSPASLPSPSHSVVSTAPSASPAYSYYSDSDPYCDPSDPPYSPSQEQRSTVFRSKPYDRPRKPGSSKGLPREVIQQERKLRKKQQNKDAATRYRQKKKEEQAVFDQECDELEARNVRLHDKVNSMTNEIQYLKDLLKEVYKAKGLKFPKSASVM